jgi:hypothetical protein
VVATLGTNGTCSEESADAVADALAVLGSRAALELAGFAGAVDAAASLPDADDGGAVENALATAHSTGCRVLGITLPKGSRFVGFHYEVEDANGRQPCLPDHPCPGETVHFTGPPRIVRGAAATVIHSMAYGDAADALMTVFFRAPNDDWAPRP